MVAAGFCQTGEVSFDVSHEDRYADPAELFRKHAQGHGFPCSRGSGDETVAIGHARQQAEEIFCLGNGQRSTGGHSHLSNLISHTALNLNTE